MVLDVHLAEKTKGQEVARETKLRRPQVVVFMCSESRDMTTISAAVRAGADDFIFKGGDERELALRIVGALQLKGFFSPQSRKRQFAGATMGELEKRVQRIAESAITAVHIQGESGTGKEVVSEVFEKSLPRGTPFVRVNCGAIPANLLESELFGYVKGAFTGADKDKKGLLEAAHGGWIFLDEVATLSPSAQIALLRVMESKKIRKVGGNKEHPIQVKVLSATNESMTALVQQQKFRGDLWQRLCEATIELSPLRERMPEFDELVNYFLQSMDKGPYRISESALEILKSYDWRAGNIRELRNCLRAMTELSVDQLLSPLAIPKHFWDRHDDSQKETAGFSATGEPASGSITVHWEAKKTSYERLCQQLLLEIVRLESSKHGKLSIRQLALLTSVPKSTLATRLKDLVNADLIAMAELNQMVGAGGKGKAHD